jgi:spermidine/putrescine transport system permease protein
MTTRRATRFIGHHLLTVVAILGFIYILLPIAVIALFSFNDPAGRFNYTWSSFTWNNWLNPFAIPALGDALLTSIQIALIVSVIATVLGTLIALGLVRHYFRGRGTTNMMIFLPMSTPEIVLGASLLALFLNLGVNTGFFTIVLAHVVFCISFCVITVKARLTGFDRRLEEAAMDLGATELRTFLRITLPLIAPGVGAAALLAFALSLDDFVITNFTHGTVVTFPLYIWGAARIGVPPQVNVIGTMIFLIAVGIMLVATLLTSLRDRRDRAMAQREAEALQAG